MHWTILLILVAALVAFLWLKRAADIAPDEAARLLRQGALLVDVRTPEEFRQAHLPGAINLPLNELTDSIRRHASDPNQVILLHCRSGSRSGVARHQLQRLGYTNVFNLGSYGRAADIVKRAGAEASAPDRPAGGP